MTGSPPEREIEVDRILSCVNMGKPIPRYLCLDPNPLSERSHAPTMDSQFCVAWMRMDEKMVLNPRPTLPNLKTPKPK